MSWHIGAMVISILLLSPFASAALDDELSSSEKQTFDKILEPVAKTYRLLKYGVSIVAAIYLLVSAAQFMASGGDVRLRDEAKTRATFVFIGMALLWATPYLISYMVT